MSDFELGGMDPIAPGEPLDLSFGEDVFVREDVFVEVTAVTMAIVKAFAELGSLSGDKRPYLSQVLDAGLRDIEEMDRQRTLNERGAAFLAKAKARYTDLITKIPAP